MELTHLNQIDFSELRLEKMDCIIATVGNQPRCYHLAQQVHHSIPKKILLITEKDEQKQLTGRNIGVFQELGFSNYMVSTEASGVIEKLLEQVCNFRVHQINLLIDYSCMPKKWYLLIIDTITKNDYMAERINLFLSYTPKLFEKNPRRHAIDYIGPIVNNRDSLKEKKPLSMIAALDINQHSILEVVGKVKPQKILAFVPFCSHDPEYTKHVLHNNKSLLDKLDSNCIINYDADRPEELNTLLTSYCLDERIASEVLIIPQGPKTFSMMSMLLSVRYPDVKLWEVILRDQQYNPDHGQPAANPVIVKVSFLIDEPE
jgi:hypothetical protein